MLGMRTSRARRPAGRPASASRLFAAALAIAVTGGLAGCATAGPVGGGASVDGEPTGGGPSGVAESSVAPEAPGVACVDWVSFGTPREAAAHAGAVLLGTVVERAGTVELFGVDANRWVVEVERVLERPEPPRDGGEPPPELPVSAGDRVPVVSTPETCTDGGAYPEGDPLDPATGLAGEDGAVIVILSGAWGDEAPEGVEDPSLITPYQGVVPPAPGGTLPAKWPVP